MDFPISCSCAFAGKTSPYLLQHGENPVEWHPRGEEALIQRPKNGFASTLPAALGKVPTLPNGTGGAQLALTKAENTRVNAWVCCGVICLPPIADFDELLKNCRFGSCA